MNIYTRRGDTGLTDTADGRRVPKADPAMEAVGTLDELNAHLGLLAAEAHRSFTQQQLSQLSAELSLITAAQRHLFGIGARAVGVRQPQRMPQAADVAALETAIDRLQQADEALFRGFVLPGGAPAAAQAHVARTVCRRAERGLLAIGADSWHDAPAALAYMNRLSDFLFAVAKKMNRLANVDEIKC